MYILPDHALHRQPLRCFRQVDAGPGKRRGEPAENYRIGLRVDDQTPTGDNLGLLVCRVWLAQALPPSACAPCHRRRCSCLCSTPIVLRRFTSPVAVGLTICHAPIFQAKHAKQSHGHVWATRYKLRSRSSLLQPNHLHGVPPFRPSNPCYCVTFCHFVSFNYPQHRFYPMIVKTQHPAPTTAFSGRSIISSSADLEGTTVGPTCESLICRSPTR
jgi:hypothetical protein